MVARHQVEKPQVERPQVEMAQIREVQTDRPHRRSRMETLPHLQMIQRHQKKTRQMQMHHQTARAMDSSHRQINHPGMPGTRLPEKVENKHLAGKVEIPQELPLRLS